MVDTNPVKFLKEWVVRYLKNKDIITRKIVSIEESEESFTIVRADKKQEFFVEPFLKDLNNSLGKLKGEYKSLVCFHTKENFEILLNEWNKFVDVGRQFMVYFINPFSKTERVLILSPYTHNLISDEDSLVLGLKTMAENVEYTTEEEVKKIISS
jgi:hypothetical protein